MLNADAHGDEGFRDAAAVVADLQNRGGAGDIEGIVDLSRKAEGLAQTAWSPSQRTRC